MTVRVLLVDDQAVVRAALRLLIDRDPGLSVIAEAADGRSAITEARTHRPDVIVMDVRMPRMTGVDATARILHDWPHPGPPPRILVLTTFDLDEYVYAALHHGAAGFLLKNARPADLINAIQVVAAGEAILAPSVTSRLIHTFTKLPPALLGTWTSAAAPGPDPLSVLTRRELEVLILVGAGRSNAEIAAELGLSESNVKSRVNRILTRLGLTNRVQAALLVHARPLD